MPVAKKKKKRTLDIAQAGTEQNIKVYEGEWW